MLCVLTFPTLFFDLTPTVVILVWSLSSHSPYFLLEKKYKVNFLNLEIFPAMLILPMMF